MSALKSVIITLPKGLSACNTTKTANLSTKTTGKLNFTTPILVDKIKMESGGSKKFQSVQHMEPIGITATTLPVISEAVVLKQENMAQIQARGKKRRLDHLTWEEKLQRKKLKNRVAAQTSRDRKKAKLDELEESVRILRERNEQLLGENAKLRIKNESLITEVKQLRSERDELAESKNQKVEVCSMCQSRVDCVTPTLGSAVSPIINPLQQGGETQKARPVTLKQSASIILKILTLYLLSKTYLANSKGKMATSTLNGLKNSPRALCERLPLKWKQILLSEMNRMQSKKKPPNSLTLQKKWWGRHQVIWKPMLPAEA